MFGIGVTEAIILSVVCLLPVIGGIAAVIVLTTQKKDHNKD
jgi:uncharacterized membrane protein YgaE (UPF0421/DUF939 family)